jgi:hypothetical protein
MTRAVIRSQRSPSKPYTSRACSESFSVRIAATAERARFSAITGCLRVCAIASFTAIRVTPYEQLERRAVAGLHSLDDLTIVELGL